MEGRLTAGKALAVVVVLKVARYGVESEMSVTTLAAAELVVVAPAKYISAFELIPVKNSGLWVMPNVDG